MKKLLFMKDPLLMVVQLEQTGSKVRKVELVTYEGKPGWPHPDTKQSKQKPLFSKFFPFVSWPKVINTDSAVGLLVFTALIFIMGFVVGE